MLDLVRSTIGSSVFSGVMIATGGMPLAGASTPINQELWPIHEPTHVSGSVSKDYHVSVTQATHREVDFRADLADSRMSADDETAVLSDTSWPHQAERSDGWLAAERRLIDIARLEDGWGGPGSRGASPAALDGAKALLGYLEQELPEGPAPGVGLDFDGFPVLSWQDDGLFGSLSLFDADSFAFYVERGERHAEDGEGRLSAQLPADLLEVLKG
ncbi:hypothetical protein [uncultured Salipiger sp.]|uniref:hypothetical protein n=1 Tax=uncultured Salipiger sp. TaxID=499810 RepID=UPI0025955010|nr:hypothetical protein [uncultured Salipiger sp.]